MRCRESCAYFALRVLLDHGLESGERLARRAGRALREVGAEQMLDHVGVRSNSTSPLTYQA